jgi:hypothetical protein
MTIRVSESQRQRCLSAINTLLDMTGYNKHQLSKAIDVSPNVVTYWFQGERMPTFKQAIDMEILSMYNIDRREFAPHIYD